ncbi:MAG: hypothetical protein AAGG68_12405 [Bacteroidota bacterium]
MSKTIFLFFALIISSISFAQTIGTNTKPIDEKRYEGITGSPYFYEDWQEATVYNQNGDALEKIEVNYNGNSNEFEAKVEGGFVELDGKNYPRIEILEDGTRFQYAVHPRLMDQYVRVLFEGEKNNLVFTFVASISTRKVQNVGSTIVKEAFVRKGTFYLLKGGELQLIKLRKKDILSNFPQKEVANLVKKEKLRLNSTKDLVKVLELVETL